MKTGYFELCFHEKMLNENLKRLFFEFLSRKKNDSWKFKLDNDLWFDLCWQKKIILFKIKFFCLF